MGVNVTWYSHACLLIDADGTRLPVDPFLTGNPLAPIGDNFTMGPDDALRAVQLIEPRLVLPIHYDTFEVIRQDSAAWKRRVEEATSARVALFQPGERLEL
jgi:L-ascorbate metabolism protein UlaG (beta-lactamase superfamily)